MFTLLTKTLLLSLLLLSVGCQVALPVMPSIKPVTSDSINYQLLQAGQLKEAERQLRIAVDQPRRSLVDQTNLGILLARTGRLEEASEQLDEVLLDQPKFCPALLQKAELELSHYRIDAAESLYLTCPEKEPAHPVALLNLGIVYEIYRGDFDRALAHYENYEQVTESSDARVATWISNLNRRLATRQSTMPLLGALR